MVGNKLHTFHNYWILVDNELQFFWNGPQRNVALYMTYSTVSKKESAKDKALITRNVLGIRNRLPFQFFIQLLSQ